MRNFEITLTYKSMMINQIFTKNIFVNHQRIMEVALDDSHCFSPEEFCNAIINLQERPNVVRVNVIEKSNPSDKPLYWLTENFGRIYFHNGIPLILNKN